MLLILLSRLGGLLNHLNKQTVTLADVKTLVLDEADRMLDMGFLMILATSFSQMSTQRQLCSFSATWPDEIAKISRKIQQDPVTIEINSPDELPAVEQQFYEISRYGKLGLLQSFESSST